MSTAPSHTHPADRDINAALNEAAQMLDIINTPENELSDTQRRWVSSNVADNFAHHVNRGFLNYRKSVTETADFALTDWYGQGSILRDIMGREYIDMLGGFGLYSPGIRHPKIVEAVKAQLDRSPQYSQEMLDPLRGQLAKVIAKLTPGELQYGFFANSGTEAVDGAMKLAKLYTGRRGFISTTGGNPLACAAALAGIRVMLEENLPQQAAEKGDYLLQKIGMLRNKYPHILKDIRGKGLLLAMVFENDEIGYKVVSGLFKRHVLTSGTLNNSSVVRLEPALNIPYELLDEVLVRLEDTLKSVSESA